MLVVTSILFSGTPAQTNSKSNSNSSALGGVQNTRFPGVFDPQVQSSQKIVFGSVRNGNHDIFVMDLDGSNQTNLTNNPAYDDQPSESPRRRQIAFMSNRDGSFEIYSMNADAAVRTRLITTLPPMAFQPGRLMGQRSLRQRRPAQPQRTFEIFVMRMPTAIERASQMILFLDGVPAWSTDGTKIVS